jgi:hypothetical protein
VVTVFVSEAELVSGSIVVTALTWTVYWFARHSRQRGWLR